MICVNVTSSPIAKLMWEFFLNFILSVTFLTSVTWGQRKNEQRNRLSYLSDLIKLFSWLSYYLHYDIITIMSFKGVATGWEESLDQLMQMYVLSIIVNRDP